MSIVRRLLETRAVEKRGSLTEMPVGDIRATDRSDDMPSFPDKRDWAMVSKPSFQKRIVNAFRKSPWTFDLYFYNLPDTDPEGDMGGPIGIIDVVPWIPDVPEAKPGRITVIMEHHLYAADRLTPWMIAHRMAHGEGRFDWDTFSNIIEQTVGSIRRPADAMNFFMMKSARERNIQEVDEIPLEVLTEFILTGDIRINPDYAQAASLRTQLVRWMRPIVEEAVGRYWVTH